MKKKINSAKEKKIEELVENLIRKELIDTDLEKNIVDQR